MAKQDKPLAQVFHFDLYGKRDEKYDFLNENSISSIQWNELKPEEPNFFLVKKNFDESGMYEKGFKVDEIFIKISSGVKTHNDSELVSFNDFHTEFNKDYFYKPFDKRKINYDLKKVIRHRFNNIKDILQINNLGIVTCRNQIFNTSILVTKTLS